MRRLVRSVGTCFASGGLVLLPLIITFGILGWIAVKLNQLLGLESAIGRTVVTATEPAGIPHAVSLIVVYAFLLFVVVLVGWAARRFAQRRMSDAIERVLGPFPIVNRVYRSVRQVVETLGGGDDMGRLGAVVIVRFANVRAWGLLANREPLILEGKEYLQVFCPSAPMPATGFAYLVPIEDVLVTDIGFEALSKVLLSLGALVHTVVPKEINLHPFQLADPLLLDAIEESQHRGW